MSTLEVKAIQAPTGYDLQMPAGAILQVVQATITNTENGGHLQASSSTSFNAVAGVTATITPKFASSKILISVATNNYRTGDSNYTIYRGSTNLGGSTHGMIRMTGNTSEWTTPVALIHLDSPNTTSATTYQLYARAESGTTYTGGDGDQLNTIILQEVAG